MTGVEISVVGPALDTLRLDQKVTVTGTLTRKDNIDVFQATKVEPVHAACQIGFSTDALKRSIKRASIGVRGGMTLDPELIAFGVQAEFGPLFRNIWVRPSAEFAFGEVTKIFSINAEFTDYLPFIGYNRDQILAFIEEITGITFPEYLTSHSAMNWTVGEVYDRVNFVESEETDRSQHMFPGRRDFAGGQ